MDPLDDESTYVTDENSDEDAYETSNQDEQVEEDQNKEKTETAERVLQPKDVSPSISSAKDSTEIKQIDVRNIKFGV